MYEHYITLIMKSHWYTEVLFQKNKKLNKTIIMVWYMYVYYTEFISKEQEKIFPCFPWYVLFNNFEGESEKRRFQKDGVIVKEERSTTVYCWVKAPGRRGQESAANCTGWADDCRRERRVETRRRTERSRPSDKHRRTNEKNLHYWCMCCVMTDNQYDHQYFKLVIDRYRFFITDTNLFHVYVPDNRYAELIFIYCYRVNK